MALVERKIMLTHVSNAVKLFLNMNIDVNTLSVGGLFIIQSLYSSLVSDHFYNIICV